MEEEVEGVCQAAERCTGPVKSSAGDTGGDREDKSGASPLPLSAPFSIPPPSLHKSHSAFCFFPRAAAHAHPPLLPASTEALHTLQARGAVARRSGRARTTRVARPSFHSLLRARALYSRPSFLNAQPWRTRTWSARSAWSRTRRRTGCSSRASAASGCVFSFETQKRARWRKTQKIAKCARSSPPQPSHLFLPALALARRRFACSAGRRSRTRETGPARRADRSTARSRASRGAWTLRRE